MLNIVKFSRIKFVLPALLVMMLFSTSSALAQDQTVYTDSLQNGWIDWSWATVNLNATGTVHGGTSAISVTGTAPWQALYLHHNTFPAANYSHLSFWINGGQGGQQLEVAALSGGNPNTAVSLNALTANTWQQITIPLVDLGMNSSSTVDGLWIKDRAGSTHPAYYIDDIKLIAGTTPPPPSTAVAIQIDALANRRTINPYIYGTAFGTSAQLLDLNAPLNRHGGNTTTRYNWQQNADNHANDWYFQSISNGSSVAGADGDSFIQTSKNGGSLPMLTIPMIDWVAKVGPNREKLASFSIAKYGAQTDADWEWMPDAGNGIRTNGQYITNNDKNDANVPNSVALQQGWVQHLISRWGNASGDGLRYYILDNEHSIWQGTHRDVQPVGPKMDEIYTKMRDYAVMIKNQDANAKIMGPEEWGWGGYFYSGFDQQWAPNHNWERPDKTANGNMDYMPWMLQKFKNYETQNGRRLLDVFTLHYYPQGGEYSEDVSAAMQLRRNRSTRSLWDPNYVDESWVADTVKLVPRMRSWVTQYYPNTPIGLTEYSWGADNHINGATTQADVLGILGREGIDMATRWVTPVTPSPTYKAMKMFRNYDGNQNGFGDINLSASVPDPDNVSAFASVRTSDGALTVMVVNKVATAAAATVNLANFSGDTTAQVWQLTAANQINRLADISVSGNVITATLPPQSVTLIVYGANAIASPSELTGTRLGNSIRLMWQDNSSDENGFVVEKAKGSGAFTEVFRSAANITEYRALLKAGIYSYRVKTLRAGAFSPPSNTVQAGR